MEGLSDIAEDIESEKIALKKKLNEMRLTLMDSKPKKEELKYIYHLILN